MKCKIVAKVLYDYEAQTDEELTIKEGGILLITDDTDQDWWTAYERPLDTFQEGRTGLVPLTYVEEATPICIVNAIYDYDAQTDEEITIREGDLIRIYEKVDADWWFGKHDHDVGLVPSTYVEEQHDSGPAPIPPPAVDQADAEAQKNQLLNALGGLGFKKTETKEQPSGIIYGPDDIPYYAFVDIDKKKKKNSVKGLLGVSAKEKKIYFLYDTKEIIYTIPIKSVKKYSEKKTKLTIQLESDTKEYEAQHKSEVLLIISQIEMAMSAPDKQPSPVAPMPSLPTPTPTPPAVANPASSIAKVAIALYDYEPVESGELAIVENDMLIVLDNSDPDWWLVKHLKKHGEGLVPKTYVELQTPGVARKPQEDAKEKERQELERKRQEELRREEMEREEERQREERRRAEEQRKQEEKRREEERQREEERRKEEERKAAIPQVPTRPKLDTPSLPTRPTEVPTLPTRPKVEAVAVPTLPTRPVANVPTIPKRPEIPESRPTVPVSRPKVESAPEKKDFPDPAKIRDWTDKTGKFTVKAAYHGISDNKVQLHKENGVIIGVPFEKLDDTSLDYLRSVPGNEKYDFGSKLNAPLPPQQKKASSTNLLSPVDNSAHTFNGFDWKDWLVKAGVASSDASTYAQKFVDQRMDSSILSDIDRDALRAMGITEGDIIRIRKAANLPQISAQVRAKTAQNEVEAQARNLQILNARGQSAKQIADDEALARELQNQEYASHGRPSNVNKVNPATLFEAGNLLKAGNKSPTNTRAATNTTSNFNKPPSTQHVSNAPSLGLSSNVSSLANNDPWGAFSGPANPSPQTNTTSAHDPFLKAKQQQEETQKTLETARLAIQKANEQAKQAAALEEQNRLAKQSELALQKAQETAKQAMLIQQQAHQKLMAAQQGGISQPILPMQTVPMQPLQPMPMQTINPAQFAPRPLVAPLIPTPSANPTPGFVPTGALAGNALAGNAFNSMNPTMMTPQQTGIATKVTSSGVVKPSWSNASALTPNMTGNSGNFAQNQLGNTFSNTRSSFHQPGFQNQMPTGPAMPMMNQPTGMMNRPMMSQPSGMGMMPQGGMMNPGMGMTQGMMNPNMGMMNQGMNPNMTGMNPNMTGMPMNNQMNPQMMSGSFNQSSMFPNQNYPNNFNQSNQGYNQYR
ncbi:cytoskeletal protein binding protein [Boothiomyces sp. JEL0838]|nr:cytoskeletal protein binding protein [Boothiomyces sp. JEL0838]